MVALPPHPQFFYCYKAKPACGENQNNCIFDLKLRYYTIFNIFSKYKVLAFAFSRSVPVAATFLCDKKVDKIYIKSSVDKLKNFQYILHSVICNTLIRYEGGFGSYKKNQYLKNFFNSLAYFVKNVCLTIKGEFGWAVM